ncbi:hypothetical protein L0F63_002309 [Massospora cicadina]|nr:hypothetical protein L0F63_002309 [Massospora cicadina]
MLLQTDALPPGWVAFASALSGGAGAALALGVTYPLDRAKTILQVPPETPDERGAKPSGLGSPSGKDPTTMLEGLVGLYNGLAVGVLQVVANSFVYFYFYSFIRNYHLKRTPFRVKEMHATLPVWAELGVGGMAGILAQLVTLPSRKLMLGTWAEIRDDGYSGLWRGLKPSLALMVNPSITYGVFEKLKGRRNLTSIEIIFGAISKSVATILTYPYIVAKVRLQWKAPGSSSYAPYRNSLDVLKRVFRNKGLPGWYEGVSAQISKAVLSQVILFLVKEKVTFSVTMLLIATRAILNKHPSLGRPTLK